MQAGPNTELQNRIVDRYQHDTLVRKITTGQLPLQSFTEDNDQKAIQARLDASSDDMLDYKHGCHVLAIGYDPKECHCKLWMVAVYK